MRRNIKEITGFCRFRGVFDDMKKSNQRASGILLSITSLPSEYGIGTMGKAAYEFVDFLKKSGQRYWQMLPVGCVDPEGSPY